MDNLFQSPDTINTQRKDSKVTNERQIASDVHAETMKEFKGVTIQSTISNYAHSDSEEIVDAVSNSEELDDAVSDPKINPSSDPKIATYTVNGNSLQNYWQTDKSKGSSKVSSLRFTKRLQMGFLHVDGLCVRYVRF